MRIQIVIFSLFIGCFSVFGENIEPADSLRTNDPVLDNANSFRLRNFIIPTALISYGVAARFSESLRNIDYSIHEEIKANVTRRYTFDDQLQFASPVAMLALNLSGVPSRHNSRDQAIIYANAYLLNGASVRLVKRATQVPRPNEGRKNAFPSGHTANAFVGAHILFKEYRDVSPWIGVAGYLSATTVAAMRMINQRHWLSDVVAGAGFGILTVELSYLMLPIYHRLFGITSDGNGINSVFVAPIVGTNLHGAALSVRF